jgi:hypothetical protein
MLGLRRIHKTIRTIPPVRLQTFCNKSHRNDNLSFNEFAIISLLYSGGMGGATYGLCNGYMISRKDNFLNCVSMTTTCFIFGCLSGTGMVILSPIIIPIGCIVYGIRCVDKTVR